MSFLGSSVSCFRRGLVLAGGAVMLAASVAGCHFFSCGEPAPDVVCTAEDSGKTITLKPNETVRINLESNPSTGYSWQAFLTRETTGGDPGGPVVAITGEKMVEDDTRPEFVGVPGTQQFDLKALRAGAATIDLYYYRSWETLDKSKDRHVGYTIQVAE